MPPSARSRWSSSSSRRWRSGSGPEAWGLFSAIGWRGKRGGDAMPILPPGLILRVSAHGFGAARFGLIDRCAQRQLKLLRNRAEKRRKTCVFRQAGNSNAINELTGRSPMNGTRYECRAWRSGDSCTGRKHAVGNPEGTEIWLDCPGAHGRLAAGCRKRRECFQGKYTLLFSA
jgi:hypothetical protein